LVSLLVIASILMMASFTSATSIVNLNSVKVNGLEALNGGYNVSVLAGSILPVTVTFTANAAESNVRLSAELYGVTSDAKDEILVGDVEAGKTYIRTLNIKVPTDMADVQSDNLNLVLNVWNGDTSVSETTQTITLRQQRQTYNVQVMSLNTVSSVKAGELLPVDVVLKNTGYNQLNDLYVTVSVPALGLERTAYFGDIKTASDNDTVTGRIFLQVPYNATAGNYAIKAEVRNSNLVATSATSVSVENQFQSNVVAQDSTVEAGIGADAHYSLTIVNPTNNIALYKIVPETSSSVNVNADSVVAVPAGSSKTVTLTAKASSEGDHNFTVNVFNGDQLTGKVDLTLTANSGVSNPVAILTIVLAVIFVVLLVVLIVLVTKKPAKKQEEFGESYY
jgi:hypothetical protein